MNSDGTGQTRLTNDSSSDFLPSFSPDGNRIVFVRNVGLSNNDIYVMNADGTGQTPLTDNPAFDSSPQFSPDGTRIVFDSVRDGNFEIYVMNANGAGQMRLTNNAASDSRAEFSPDGGRLVFESSRDGNGEIYVMNVDTSGLTRITSNSVADFDATFSSEGCRIAFTSRRDGNDEIYVMGSDGGNQTHLTNAPGIDGAPDWRPSGGPISCGSPTPTPTPTTGAAIYRINSGGPEVAPFSADNFVTGGAAASTIASINTSGVINPAPSAVYQTERFGTFTYTFPGLTPGATYTARLHFAEIFHTGPGQRAFNVAINANPVLNSYDIFADAGGANKAVVKEFVTTANSSGQIVIVYTPFIDNPKSSGIEIIAGGTPTPPPTPTPGPAGGRIAFFSERDGNYEIYVMNADGSNQTRLTNNPTDDSDPSFSPDGSRIAFVSRRDGNKEIYVMNADGSNQTRLTNNSESDDYPSFSPDGRIAFYSHRDGNFEIYVMNADSSNPTRLTNNSSVDARPHFSPDGARITFFSDRDGDRDIFVMNPDGSDQTRLTNNSFTDDFPSYSPDGSRIAFESHRDSNFDTYAINADGTNENRITNHSAIDSNPSWGPSSATSTPTPTPSPTPGGPPGLTADYQFQNTRNSSEGGPALTDLITSPNAANSFATETVDAACSPRTVLNFPKGNGLSLAPTTGVTTDNKTYSIVVLFRFTEQNHNRAIVDFKNGVDGRGIYADGNNNLAFYNSFNNGPGISVGSGSPITTNRYVQMVLTRQGSDANFGRAGIDTGYVDGVHQYRNDSVNADGIVDPPFNTLRFFLNQLAAAQDYSGGAVARIRVFNRVLTAAEVAALDRLPGGSCGGPSPTPTPTPTPGGTPTPIPTPTATPPTARLAFSSNRDGNDEIYLMNPDGTGQTRLTNNTASDVQPDFSADGSRIVFQSDRDGVQQIYVMNRDGTGQMRLTDTSGKRKLTGCFPC